MAEQVATPLVEDDAFDEFHVTAMQDPNGEDYPFLSAEQQQGDVYIETPDRAIYRISVGEDDVTVASGEMTRHGFAPVQEPVSIAQRGLVTVFGQPRSQRSKQHEVREFDVTAENGRLSIISDEVPLRVVAPAGYFPGYRPQSKAS